MGLFALLHARACSGVVQSKMLQDVLDALDEGVVVFDDDHIVVAANALILQVLEIDPSNTIIGVPIRDTILMHGDLKGLALEEIEKEVHVRYKLICGGYHESGSFTERRRTRDGRMIEMRRKPWADRGAIITTLDVTAEAELERRTKQLETVIEKTDDGVFQIDEQGQIELFNESMVRFYRMDQADVSVGDHVSKFVKHLLSVTHMAPEALTTFNKIGTNNSGLERPLIQEQLIKTIWGDVFQVSRARLPGGGAIATHKDITVHYERQKLLEQAKAEAEDASRLKSEFIARVTHELRTPMHGVLGIAALLERSGLDQKQLRFLETLQRSGRHMVDLIDGLLTISTLETGDLMLDTQATDLDLLLEDSFEMLRPRAAEKQLSFVLETDLAISSAMVDGTRLTQIIVNLLANAIKFTEQGKVRLSASSVAMPEAVVLLIEIADTGPGIPDDKLEQIFEKFAQIGAGRGATNEGVGLGLAIARSLTELMSGRLSLRSEVGEGTIFRLEVPLHPICDQSDGADWIVSSATSPQQPLRHPPQ